MRIILISIISIVLFSTAIQSCYEVEIICRRIRHVPYIDGTDFVCECYTDTSLSSVVPGSRVTSVVNFYRLEIPEKVLSKLEAININQATVKFIPTGIKSRFTSLKALGITSCGLLSVNKEDLREFGESLDLLALDDNLLTSIDADLFDFNPNLRAISLGGNPIRYIESRFFTTLSRHKKVELLTIGAPDGCLHKKCCTLEKFGTNPKEFSWNDAECNDKSARVQTKKLLNDINCESHAATENLRKRTKIRVYRQTNSFKNIFECV